MSAPRRILLGIVTAAHGLKGEIVVKSFAEFPEDVAAYGPLFSEDGARSFALHVVNVTTKGVVARVKGVNDRTGAERLKGEKLYVDRAALPAAEDGAYYFEDLIGLAAVAADGAAIGTVVAVHDFGAGPLLEVALAARPGRTELLPFTDAVVPMVDLAAGKLTLVMPETIEVKPDAGDGPAADPASEV